MSRRRLIMQNALPDTYLLALQEVEVSMLCFDGSDNKGNAFQLTALGADLSVLNSYCYWTTSDPNKATVSNGLVSAVSGGVGDVSISATFKGVSFSCLFTVYATMPNDATRYTIKGGKGQNTPGNDADFCYFSPKNVPDYPPFNSFRLKTRFFAPNNNGYFCSMGASPAYIGSKAIGAGSSFGQIHSERVVVSTATQVAVYIDTFGPSLTAGTKYDKDISISSDGFKQNGVVYTPTVLGPTIYTSSAGYLYLYFQREHEKTILFSWNTASISEISLLNKSLCGLFYIPQNYVRYYDRGSFVTQTKIPNLGTLGNTFDAFCNVTPAGWF